MCYIEAGAIQKFDRQNLIVQMYRDAGNVGCGARGKACGGYPMDVRPTVSDPYLLTRRGSCIRGTDWDETLGDCFLIPNDEKIHPCSSLNNQEMVHFTDLSENLHQFKLLLRW